MTTLVWAAESKPEGKDSDHNGKLDTWVSYDTKGDPEVIADDNNHADGKPHHWRYYKDGAVYKREWDRNFDGKADFRTLETKSRLLEKQYDDDFDGEFEKKVKID